MNPIRVVRVIRGTSHLWCDSSISRRSRRGGERRDERRGEVFGPACRRRSTRTPRPPCRAPESPAAAARRTRARPHVDAVLRRNPPLKPSSHPGATFLTWRAVACCIQRSGRIRLPFQTPSRRYSSPMRASPAAERYRPPSVSIASSGGTEGDAVWSSTPKAAANATRPVMRWTIAESACLAQEQLLIVGSSVERARRAVRRTRSLTATSLPAAPAQPSQPATSRARAACPVAGRPRRPHVRPTMESPTAPVAHDGRRAARARAPFR
jgi:hypothetical protein